MTSGAQVIPMRTFHHGNLRQGLIDAALRAPDIEGLSLRQLAAGLGVTAAAAYRHFGSLRLHESDLAAYEGALRMHLISLSRLRAPRRPAKDYFV
jgi:AcrR family transcriptional regulator